MRLPSLMMYIYPVLLFILYINNGFSEAAPRIGSYDASPISRKPRSASETSETRNTILPNRVPEDRFVHGPLTGLTPSPVIVSTGASNNTVQATTTPVSKTATTFLPPTTDPTTRGIESISTTEEQITASASRLNSKRSTDAQTSVFPQDKMLQTMVSMVPQRTANDAWSADNIGPSITSTENSQGECMCVNEIIGSNKAGSCRLCIYKSYPSNT